MRVSYKGFLSSLAGVSEEEVEIEPGATVARLLEELAARHGESFRNAVMPGGSRRLVALVSVDGAPAGADDVLHDGARVLLVRAVGGG
ncbi:MAG: MoaD/ThiS family protein [Bacillota bacterium]|nr:MoaD/ThiS family protein [Bacillota bacterium]